jgi:hypothetical protein
VFAAPTSLYRLVLRCLYPDKTPDPTVYRQAFDAFMKIRHVRI